MRRWTLAVVLASVVGFVLLMGAPAQAQRTGDHIVPSIETVCDNDPYAFGTCNAYCEAMDCDSPTPLGTPRACANHLKHYLKKSGGIAPPCACPCGFNLPADVATMVAFGTEELGVTILPEGGPDGPAPIAKCGAVGPNSQEGFSFEAFEAELSPEDPDATVELGGRIFYWIDEPAEGEPTCNVLGRGIDGPDDFPGGEGQFILPVPPNDDMEPLSIELDESEVGSCQAVLDFLCTQV